MARSLQNIDSAAKSLHIKLSDWFRETLLTRGEKLIKKAKRERLPYDTMKISNINSQAHVLPKLTGSGLLCIPLQWDIVKEQLQREG